MNNNITLNASMRNNLLSLRNISKQMDKTQLILATGKKVNSAIDNASAYYQARSLSNRAADLTALLDAMGQGIQTIEAATQGLTSGAEFLEQAAAVVSEAASITAVPEKEWFIEQVGENGAVVSTAQELRDAITAGKETICVYGAIDLGDISISGGLELKANQKLVGVGYFGNYDTNVDKFSSITATASTVKNMISITKDNCVISDLSINYTNSVAKGSIAVISINSSFTIETELSNLDMNIEYSDDSSNTSPRTAINILNGAKVNLSESININISGNYGRGISTYGSVCNIKARALVNVVTSGKSCYGITSSTNATFNIEKDSKVLIETSGSSGHGIMTYNSAIFNIDGIVRVSSKDSYGIYSSYTSGNVTKIGSSANIYFDCAMPPIYIDKATANGANVLEIAAGAKLAFVQDGNEKWFKVDEYYNYENSASSAYDITFDNVETILNVENMAAWSLPEIIAEMAESTNGDLSEYSASYQKILDEYDNLIMDSSYQGVNLLNGALKEITLNENRSNKYKIEGKDMSSENIGLSRNKWETLDDVTKAMNELTAAINSIRSFQEELGNHYSIIKTRINFTEALTDILETGADNLTLADMNEASAEYLTLQTRQQLAINSLSLASQSARSVLSLF